MGSLTGKVALVTGGSRGIGAAIAKALAAEGADVAITYAQSADKAEAVVASIRQQGRQAQAIQAQASDARQVIAAVDQVVEEFGRLDILVNNAGNLLRGTIDTLELEDFDRTFLVNVKAVYAAILQAAKYLPEGGRIISIGSCIGTRTTRAGSSLYAASKSALVGLTKGVARDLGGNGVTVNLIQPGPINTDMNPADGPSSSVLLAKLAVPTYGSAEQVAATVVHLASPSSGYITGSVIDVDGGFNA
ncbi:SDR family NAD(P)-dependent oxidoreductase [Pseudomonas sp. 5P_3.1_Bac2]|uniref:SDR family NAD(P)-dependent oxidoreductase n=1 Tax=Pseudomonas sp. 5P_3.1_Bac2 TaxID=2971617 RepID=UPI0021C9519B|nr:SDR family oxidoreductase [Pseudomonas sp. 5P_3.1_Bac2]MCU1717003.1 SDR family oxidoreductase [Pseudomonas sp. 5P_3.1_Bac2]